METEGEERFLKVVRRRFSRQLDECIGWLTERCLDYNLGPGLRDLNGIISNARSLGVTTAESVTEEEMRELAKKLGKLRAKKDIAGEKKLLRGVLLRKGVSVEALGPE